MAVTFFYDVEDGDGDKSRISIPMDLNTITSTTTITNLIEVVWDFINPLTLAHLVTAGFTIEADISGYTNTAADVLADVQEKAEFVFRTADGFLKRLNIPAFVETLFGGGGKNKEVDITDPDVAAFDLFMTAGTISGITPVNPVDTRGFDLIGLEKARENWGKRRI